MIRVKDGYLLDLHPPTEYNYRWQSVPSGIVRYTEQPIFIPPVGDDDPIELELTTGDKAFFTDERQYLLFRGTTISFSSRGTPSAVQHTISSVQDSTTGLYQPTRDGSRVTWTLSAQTAPTYALMVGKITLDGSGAYTYEARLFARFLRYDGWRVEEADQYNAGAFFTWLQAQQIMIKTQQVQQQEFLYTVTGGVVPSGGE